MGGFKTPAQSICQQAYPSLSLMPGHQNMEPLINSFGKVLSIQAGMMVPANLSVSYGTSNIPCGSGFPPSAGDPFVNNANLNINSKSRKLSPTADPFLPRQLMAIPEFSVLETDSSAGKTNLPTSSNSSLASDRTLKESEASDTYPMAEGIFDQVYPLGDFASDRFTRYLKVSGVPATLSSHIISVLIKGKTYSVPDSTLDIEHLRREGVIVLEFASIVDAVNAAGEIPTTMTTWKTDFINARQYSEIMTGGKGPLMSVYKGQLAIIATHKGLQKDFSEMEIIDRIVDMIKYHGSILAWDVVKTASPHVYIHMEYYDIRESEKAKQALDGTTFGGLELSIKDYVPNFESKHEPIKVVSDITTSIDEDLNTIVESINADNVMVVSNPDVKQPVTPSDKVTEQFMATSSRPLATPAYRVFSGPMNFSPSRYPTTFPGNARYGYGLAGHHYGISPSVGNPSTFPRAGFPSRRPTRMSFLNGHAGNNFGGNNNVVNVNRIVHGQDVRTTIMLRNIPNKMPQSELKEFMDETNFAEYDFMYLRIDFANNCNVGYAFINFVDPLAIAKFVKARAGTKWSRYNSDKVAEISYATIQGKDCLIQKFRNSSIMLEDTSFRPKLFHTGDGPLAGREEIFPGPDNDTKLRRSIENAGAIGLFAPRAGQYFREAQRRRRSQFDRGTHSAQLEEQSYGSAYGLPMFDTSSTMGPSLLTYSAPPHRLTF